MEEESRQSWLLIAIAALGLVLGAISLFVAFDAKSASEDAADQASVTQVSNKLSRLIDRLGIAEASLSGEQKAQQGRAQHAQRQSRDESANLSKRLDALKRQTQSLEASTKQVPGLRRQVSSLESQVGAIDSRITALNQRVTKLSRRVNDSGGQASG